MLSKNVATVRVSNISSTTQAAELYQFFQGHGLTPLSSTSLCSSFSCPDAALIATVTFATASIAKRALELNGQFLKSQRIRIDRDFIGFTTLVAPLGFTVNIVAVHGLNGHGYGTWTSFTDEKAAQEMMWLRDILPSQATDARIIAYGYNSALLGSDTSVSSIHDFGLDLLQRISSYKDLDKPSDRQRPLIFICHSLGGLVVKQALITAHENRQRYGDIVDGVQAILFFATPHRGSQTAKAGTLLSNLARIAFQKPPKHLLKALNYDSDVVSELSEKFRAIHSRFDIVNCYERRKTPIVNTLVVDEESSRLGVRNEVLVPIDATHSHICRFDGLSDPNFTPVLVHIRRMARLAEGKNRAMTQSYVRPVDPPGYSGHAEGARSWTPSVDSQHTSTRGKRHLVWRRGIFDVPNPINPNFQGRSAELKAIDNIIRASKESSCQPGARVAIHGLGGVGKTQLATQHVYRRCADLSEASIFWISARKAEEISAGLRSIAQQLELQWGDDQNKADGHGGREAAHNAIFPDVPSDESLLKHWMLTEESGNWLLILDNFDDLKVKIYDFIPRGAVGSVLFTTRDRNIIGPIATSGIELNAMDYESARTLFLSLSEPNIEHTSAKLHNIIEEESLDNILRELQCFPLAIDQAACFVRENAPMSLNEYYRYLQPRSEDRERLLRFKQINPDYPHSVMTTWEISLDYLNRVRPQASQILQLLGFFNNEVSERLLVDTTKPIAWTFHPDFKDRNLPSDVLRELQYLRDDVGFRIAIGALTSLSLVQRNLERGTLTVHPLVHEWIRVRLNSTPERQTELTTSACKVLLHSFPCDLLFDLKIAHKDKSSSPETASRLDRVQTHLGAALLNVNQYCAHQLALECFLVFESCVFAGVREHKFRGFTFPRENWKILYSSVQFMIPLLAVQYRGVASLIHLALPLVPPQNEKSLEEVLKRILEALKSLKATLPSNDTIAILLMMLLTAVFDVTDHRNRERQRTTLSSINRRSIESEATRIQNFGKTEGKGNWGPVSLSNFRCFKLLWRFRSQSFSSAFPSLLGSWLEFLILRQLVLSSSPRSFTALSEINTGSLMDPTLLGYLSIEEQGHYLCSLAQRLWEIDGPKDFERVKCLFLTASRCWENLLEEERKEEGKMRWEQVWSASVTSSSYIGNSFGRSAHLENPELIDTRSLVRNDLIAPLSYVWTIALDVFLRVSSPHTLWIIRRDGEDFIEFLDIIERRWAQEIAARMKELYEKISSGTEDKIMNYMSETMVKIVKFRIAVNLQQWKTALDDVPDLFHSKTVVNICNKAEAVPWLSPINNEPDALTHDTKINNLELREFNSVAAKGGAGQLGPANLDTVKVDRWNVPQSCESVLDRRYDGAIAAFVTLALAKEFISPAENAIAMAKLKIIHRLRESDEGHLGRLELIYWLTQKLPDLHSEDRKLESIKFRRARNSIYYEDLVYGGLKDLMNEGGSDLETNDHTSDEEDNWLL